MDDRKLKGELQNSEEEDLTEKGDQKQQSPQEASLMLMNREIYRAPSLKLQKLIKAKDRIPEDVIFNKILVRLPVKTILRFKSASKLWCSTISSQEFAKAHLKRSISDPSTKSVISNIDACGLFKLNYASYDNLDEENDDEVSAHGGGERLVQLDITFLQRFHLAGSCHGLVALLNLSYTSLYIWNPSIKLSSKILFPSEVEDLTCTDQWLNFYYGFGYVSSIDDYEFFVGDLRGINFKYTQVTDKWSEIDSKYIPGIESLEASNFRGLLVGETLHWIMYDSEVENLFNAVCILGLSLVNETLQEIPLPSFALNNGAEDLHVELYDLGGCLAAGMIDRGLVEIWTFKQHGVNITWEKLLYNFSCYHGPVIKELSYTNFFGFTKTGKLLMVLEGGGFCLVDLSQVPEKFISLGEVDVTSDIQSISYIESLVFPEVKNA